MRKKLWSVALVIGMLVIGYAAVWVFGRHGLFALMWGFFLAVSISMLIIKEDRFTGIMWGIFTLGVLALYLWNWTAS